MRAKPDMEPWVNTDKSELSSVGAALLQSPGWNEGKARYGTLGKHRQKNEKSPVRATLLQSPRRNEGKARYETLGKHR